MRAEKKKSGTHGPTPDYDTIMSTPIYTQIQTVYKPGGQSN